MPIWPTNRDGKKEQGKKLYWFKIWDLKDKQEWVNQDYLFSFAIIMSLNLQRRWYVPELDWHRKMDG